MSANGANPNAGAIEWARVKLTQGQSGAGLWDLSSEVPEARIAVGAGTDAGWQVQAEGVASIHFELFWDGVSLWVSPGHGVPVLVEGVPVSDWRQIVGRAQVDFGGARMSVESSFTGAPVSNDFAHDMGGATVASDDFSDFAEEDDDGAKTAVFDPDRHSMPDAPSKPEEFAVGSTRLVRMPGHGGAPAEPAGAAAPRFGAAAPAPPSAPRSGGAASAAPAGAVAPAPPLAPRFGGAAASAEPDTAPAIVSPPAAPLDAESTRILDTSSEPPGEFGEAGSTRILDTSSDPAFGGDAAMPQFGAGRGGGLDEVRPTHVPGQFNVPEKTDVIGAKDPTGRFAPPPPSAGAKPNPFAKLLALPKRTLILAGVTLFISVVGLVLVISQHSSDQAYLEAQAQFAAQQTQISQAAAARSARALADREARTAREAAQRERALAEAPPPPAMPTTDERGEPLDEAGMESARAEVARIRARAEREAAELLVHNDYIHALPHYVRLARDYPDTQAFAAMVVILRAKIDAFCRLPASAGSEACQ